MSFMEECMKMMEGMKAEDMKEMMPEMMKGCMESLEEMEQFASSLRADLRRSGFCPAVAHSIQSDLLRSGGNFSLRFNMPDLETITFDEVKEREMAKKDTASRGIPWAEPAGRVNSKAAY